MILKKITEAKDSNGRFVVKFPDAKISSTGSSLIQVREQSTVSQIRIRQVNHVIKCRCKLTCKETNMEYNHTRFMLRQPTYCTRYYSYKNTRFNVH